jgi:hypothetical protein
MPPQPSETVPQLSPEGQVVLGMHASSFGFVDGLTITGPRAGAPAGGVALTVADAVGAVTVGAVGGGSFLVVGRGAVVGKVVGGVDGPAVTTAVGAVTAEDAGASTGSAGEWGLPRATRHSAMAPTANGTTMPATSTDRARVLAGRSVGVPVLDSVVR